MLAQPSRHITNFIMMKSACLQHRPDFEIAQKFNELLLIDRIVLSVGKIGCVAKRKLLC
jgi:hypothetical protein